ncbi:MAG TPA: peptidylprolyl isomerase [Sphingobium sp.]|nr:peptidylprolyl isomerase [Sphingobium sp.]
MMRLACHALAAAVLILPAASARAQDSAATASMSAPPEAAAPANTAAQALKPAPKTVPVVLNTSLGPITIALEVERAPLTAGNFLRYVDEKRLDGTVFYRAFKYDDEAFGGFIQGGTQNDPKRILKPVPHEPTDRTGLSHGDGVISMAQGAPGTATGDFFVMVEDQTGFDATADQPGYAAFGRVVSGMDVIRAIWNAPRSPTKGEGIMQGQMLEPEVKILTARRAPAG